MSDQVKLYEEALTAVVGAAKESQRTMDEVRALVGRGREVSGDLAALEAINKEFELAVAAQTRASGVFKRAITRYNSVLKDLGITEEEIVKMAQGSAG